MKKKALQIAILVVICLGIGNRDTVFGLVGSSGGRNKEEQLGAILREQVDNSIAMMWQYERRGVPLWDHLITRSLTNVLVKRDEKVGEFIEEWKRKEKIVVTGPIICDDRRCYLFSSAIKRPALNLALEYVDYQAVHRMRIGCRSDPMATIGGTLEYLSNDALPSRFRGEYDRIEKRFNELKKKLEMNAHNWHTSYLHPRGDFELAEVALHSIQGALQQNAGIAVEMIKLYCIWPGGEQENGG